MAAQLASGAAPKGINVAIIGVGLVGSAVISQLAALPILNIISLQNSRKILLSPSSAALKDWKSSLDGSTDSVPALPELVATLQKLTRETGRHTAVVDNTSNDSVASFYPEFLKAGFSVVTPNKKGVSGSLELYTQILKLTNPAQAGAPLFYGESTVGAGLPILGTLKDLVSTGDEVIKIEGVLSGTLSYIFNEFSTPAGATVKFSEVVKVAKDNGYTEPHPDADLSGSDVSRKLTILSRLIPSLVNLLPQGFESVPTSSLTPEGLKEEQDGEVYTQRLKEFDGEFDALRSKAASEGKVLRYVGTIDVAKKEIKASLESYPATHPFATSLSGSDNIIAFHTKRYSARPLLVQGAGAGADVTASGVTADLLRVAERRG
ncbi:homoserine dehydrogenase [Ceraceosorus bombacis]|uniref:Homoserine dehydrogenase n=1 Tax=Ceraceosorus bombacis TaxID=401625 RepID=A0A0P1BDL9_9BASI|nr:homoserine dehydrogenase [Ceraceosorus bombacis]